MEGWNDLPPMLHPNGSSSSVGKKRRQRRVGYDFSNGCDTLTESISTVSTPPPATLPTASPTPPPNPFTSLYSLPTQLKTTELVQHIKTLDESSLLEGDAIFVNNTVAQVLAGNRDTSCIMEYMVSRQTAWCIPLKRIIDLLQ